MDYFLWTGLDFFRWFRYNGCTFLISFFGDDKTAAGSRSRGFLVGILTIGAIGAIDRCGNSVTSPATLTGIFGKNP
jgi:hypothetical protein